jgi:tetratricopeptide (TPR) repeat protein
MRLWLILAASLSSFANLGAQTGTSPVDTIAEARRLRDANDFAGAAALMRAYVESHPDDPGSARFAALMAYWSKDRAVADSIYARAIGNHPSDADLRLEYGRFLVETGKGERAEDILAPFTARDSTSFTPQQLSRARTLLGTAAYWRGDFTLARTEFRAAVALDSSAADARRQLLEIETVAASWIRIGTDMWDDDQPLRYATVNAEGGWYLDPLTPLGVRARSTVYDVDGLSESVLTAEASFTSYFPSAHIDLDAGAGVLQRSFAESTDWTGRFTLGARLPHTVMLRAAYARAPYTSTVRSLYQAIMVQTLEGNARWGTSRGWSGELAARYASYPDDNHVSTAFGWILAPISRRETAMLHVGYGFSAQSSAENRFVPRGDISVLPSQGPTVVPGEYNPYYTPQNLLVHSALATASLRAGREVVIEAGGSYGFSAHDDAPVLIGVATPPTTTVQTAFYDRSFSPWNARGSIDWTATPAVRLALRVEHGRDAYYAFTTGRLELRYTFVAAAQRRADVH